MIMMIYVTCANAAQAQEIAQTLVNEKMVACANILPTMQAVYLWQGKLTTAEEAVLIVKTTTARCPEAMARIHALHSYETPAILAWPINAIDQDFAAWIAAAVS